MYQGLGYSPCMTNNPFATKQEFGRVTDTNQREKTDEEGLIEVCKVFE